MAEQGNWNVFEVVLPTGEFREPEIYILKTCVLLLKFLFLYYGSILYCASNYLHKYKFTV